ncbi:uncharacterized protein [Ptychodera flava]|uniref:uncharacterized protein isoform X2 n=1 Tax=Ptychodera flava TaxID=63121 RepID=UPI00396A71CB
MLKPKTQHGVRPDRAQSSPGNLRDRSNTVRNKSKNQWDQLSAWDIDDELDEIGGLSIVSWNKRSAKPKPVPNPNSYTSNSWESYLCTTGTKCSNIDDVKEFVEASLIARLKPRAHSAPESQIRQTKGNEFKEGNPDDSKSKQHNGMYESTKTFDQKRPGKPPTANQNRSTSGQHTTTVSNGNELLKKSGGVSVDVTNHSRMSKNAVNMSRLQLTLKDYRHHDLQPEEQLYTVNGVTVVKTSLARQKRRKHPNSASSFQTITESDLSLPGEGGTTQDIQDSSNAVKFSYTKSKTPGSAITLHSDTTDSSEEKHLLSATHGMANGHARLLEHGQARLERKLKNLSQAFNIMESQDLSVADILHSTPRLERHICLQQLEEPQRAMNKPHQHTRAKHSYGYDRKRSPTSENSLPPVYDQPSDSRPPSTVNSTQDKKDNSLPRMSSTTGILHDSDRPTEADADSIRAREEFIDGDDESTVVMIRDGVDLNRLTEKTVLRCPIARYKDTKLDLPPKPKTAPSQRARARSGPSTGSARYHKPSSMTVKERISCIVLGKKYTQIRHRGPPGFRANTAKNPLRRAMDTTQKKISTQYNAKNVANGGSISYATRTEESDNEPDDGKNLHWQSSLHYLYDLHKTHMCEPNVQTLTESLDRSTPYQRTAGLKKRSGNSLRQSCPTTCQYMPYSASTLPQESISALYKLSRRKKTNDFNQLTIGDRTFTVAEFTAAAAARAATARKKIASTK